MAENLGFTSETINYDNLIAGTADVVTEGATILLGEGVIARGTVLGKVTVGGKYRAYNAVNVDGSQNPVAICAEEVDATLADVITSIYLAGAFAKSKLVGYADAIKPTLRALGIFVKEV